MPWQLQGIRRYGYFGNPNRQVVEYRSRGRSIRLLVMRPLFQTQVTWLDRLNGQISRRREILLFLTRGWLPAIHRIASDCVGDGIGAFDISTVSAASMAAADLKAKVDSDHRQRIIRKKEGMSVGRATERIKARSERK